MKKAITFFLSIVFIVGCDPISPFMLLGPAIQGFIAWKDGEAHAYFEGSPLVAYQATKRALKDLSFPIVEDYPDGDGYYVESTKNNTIKIKVVRAEENITLISIRVNFMGDKPYAELIYEKIADQMHIIDFRKLDNKIPHESTVNE